jgi:hypothetical protein
MALVATEVALGVDKQTGTPVIIEATILQVLETPASASRSQSLALLPVSWLRGQGKPRIGPTAKRAKTTTTA